MRTARVLITIALLLAASGCGGGGEKKPEAKPEGKAAPSAEPTPGTSFLWTRGTVMPLRSAIAGIRFHPFIPAARIVETALIPAYHGEDVAQDRGIAFEYVSNHQSYVLSEWPHNGSPLSGPQKFGAEQGCALTGYPLGLKPGHSGVIWVHGPIISTLQPSGNASTKATVAEARRLIGRGACR